MRNKKGGRGRERESRGRDDSEGGKRQRSDGVTMNEVDWTRRKEGIMRKKESSVHAEPGALVSGSANKHE